MPAARASITLADVRRDLVRRSLFEPTTLRAAIGRMGFVQADPIRAPARAQDLILRHRVAGYRAGDLERHYPALDLDEDVVYAYGFVPPATRALLHPRAGAAPEGLARDVLDFVRRAGPTHPRELSAALGTARARNPWGGQSRATTRALEQLHYWGWLRVARRERGIRVYEPARPAADPLAPEDRLRGLALLLVELFGPLPETSLRALLRQARWAVPGIDGRATAVARLLRAGDLERGDVEGVPYLWHAGTAPSPGGTDEAPAAVRFLAPFDPLVWDRRRVEHLWGWAYRFEAYTPAARRQFGYYALPVLWADRLVGWANVAARDGRLDVDLGFVQRRPRDRGFGRALDAEVARLGASLGLAG